MLRKEHRRCTGTLRRADDGAQISHVFQSIQKNEDGILAFALCHHLIQVSVFVRFEERSHALVDHAISHALEALLIHFFDGKALGLRFLLNGKEAIVLLALFDKKLLHAFGTEEFSDAVSPAGEKRIISHGLLAARRFSLFSFLFYRAQAIRWFLCLGGGLPSGRFSILHDSFLLPGISDFYPK